MKDKESFAKCLAEKLLTYALGRELGYSDRPTVQNVTSATIADGSGLRTLVRNVFNSQAFREK